MPYTLTYVSKAIWPAGDRTSWLEEIEKSAASENKKFNITGCLIATDIYFIQTIEGSNSNINQLMRNISLDDRHRDIVVINKNYERFLTYPSWNMKFLGFNYYLNKHVDQLLFFDSNQVLSVHRAQLIKFMAEISQISLLALDRDGKG